MNTSPHELPHQISHKAPPRRDIDELQVRQEALRARREVECIVELISIASLEDLDQPGDSEVVGRDGETVAFVGPGQRDSPAVCGDVGDTVDERNAVEEIRVGDGDLLIREALTHSKVRGILSIAIPNAMVTSISGV
ncbi:hypothetical protein [Nocardia gipuzkoensis]